MRLGETLKFDSVIVRFGGEIGIKGAWTRRTYEHRLLQNIRKVLKHHNVSFSDIVCKHGRFYIRTNAAKEVTSRLTQVFGVSSFSPALETTSRINDVVAKCLQLADHMLSEGKTFAVRCRRVGEHDYKSLDVSREVGSQILKVFNQRGLSVDLKHPNVTINIEIRENAAFIFSEKLTGVGGFPLGTQPKVVCLLSGGIDSPVACWLAMKRGCPIIPIYFDNTPFTDETTTERTIKVAKALFNWAIGFPRKIYIVPHGSNLMEFKRKCPERLTCVLCKRMMYRVAERIADMERAEGIVTGESIGEQATQTLRNLRVLNEAATRYPIHRPLLGFDKVETEMLAKEIGTYDISTMKAAKCSAAPRKPLTMAKLQKVKEAEELLDIESMVQTSIESLKIMKL